MVLFFLVTFLFCACIVGRGFGLKAEIGVVRRESSGFGSGITEICSREHEVFFVFDDFRLGFNGSPQFELKLN